jgi:hypothetical protein
MGPRPARGVGRRPAGGEPLFEQLRSAYLHRDDSREWARDSDTGGWAADDSGRWEAGRAAYEDDGPLPVGGCAAAWESGSEAWDDEELDDLDEDEDEDEFDSEPLAPRAREPPVAVLVGPGGAAADQHAAEHLQHPAVRGRGAGQRPASPRGSSRPGC